MSSIFEKLNTLVNAQVNELLGRNPRSPLARIKLNPEDAEKNPHRSVQNLRQRLNEAIEYEDELQEKTELLMREAVALDQQVDAFVRAGDEIDARHVQGQLNLKQQQLAIAESELRNHRLMSRHLMKELASLESALEGQERAPRTSNNRPAKGAARRRIPVAGSGKSARPAESRNPSIIHAVTDKLDDARSGLENLLNNSPVPEPEDLADRFKGFDIVDEAPDPRRPKRNKADKPEMDARLSRLRRPEEDDGES